VTVFELASPRGLETFVLALSPLCAGQVFFIDDLNMPEVDIYGTQSPNTLLRQHIDYQHFYDRAKLTLKEVVNCQYVACMNPTTGSFTVDPRLQRHFAVFACNFPEQASLQKIVSSILEGHFQPFNPTVQRVRRLCQMARTERRVKMREARWLAHAAGVFR